LMQYKSDLLQYANFLIKKKENASPINEYSISKFSASIFLSMFLLKFSAI